MYYQRNSETGGSEAYRSGNIPTHTDYQLRFFPSQEPAGLPVAKRQPEQRKGDAGRGRCL